MILGRASMVNQLHKYGAKDDTKTKTKDDNIDGELEEIFNKYLRDKGIHHLPIGKISKILHRKHWQRQYS